MPAVAEPRAESKNKILPPYHVIIENDEDHSQLFVIMVLRKVFGYDEPKAIQLMTSAEEQGEAIVWTGSKEVAERKLEQMQTFQQKHARDGRELGSLRCRIEAAS